MSDIDDEGAEVDFEIESEDEDSIDEIFASEEATSASESERLETAKKLRDWIDRSKPENHLILDRLEHDIREDVRLENWSAFALEDLMRPPRYSILITDDESWPNSDIYKNCLSSRIYIFRKKHCSSQRLTILLCRGKNQS
jgi:hypothetical protein